MAATVWKGHLSFGLVSIPVRLYRAARSERVSLHQLYRPAAAAPAPEREVPPGVARQGPPGPVPVPARRPAAQPEPPPPERPAEAGGPVARVRQQMVPESGGQPVPRSDLVKGYEYQKDRYVVLDKGEIEAITPKTSDAMQILEFVRFDEIDPVYLESSYFVAPEKTGERAYAMLFEAMRRTGLVALARVAMHRREHVVIVRPGKHGILAHTMFYEDEIRWDQEYHADTSAAGDKEIELAVMFIRSLAGKFEPGKYRDTFREKLKAMIEAKAQGREIAEAPAPKPAGAEVIDIVDALQKSLALQRKPPATAAESAPAEAGIKETKRPRRRGTRS